MIIVRIQILTFFWLSACASMAQSTDTVRLNFDQILMLEDTIYYGLTDSLVPIESGIEYELVKNILVRKPSYYQRKTHKKESILRLHNKYGKLLMGQIRSKQENLPEDFNPSDNYYTFYQNRVITEIKIEGVPVFDGNIFDTTNVNMSGIGRFLNKTYNPTRERVIRKNLKFNPNDKVDARIFSDNERLLRNLSYIEDARIQIEPVAQSTDSVIILVIVKDKYPIGVGGDISDYNAFEIEPYSRNFLGLGHNTGAIFQFDGSADEKFGYGIYYAVNNMSGTFVDGKISYGNGLDQDLLKVEFVKPFLTADTKFGGEIIFEQLTQKIAEKPNLPDSIYNEDEKYSVQLTDIWMGYSYHFQNDLTRPFLNFSGRFYAEFYRDRPDLAFEINYPFHSQELYLSSVSFQQVSYIKTTKLIQLGVIEDVPIGINLNLTGGWQHTSFFERPYIGARLNYSQYYQNVGIFSAGIDVGGFRYNSDFEDAVFAFNFDYLSPLGKWKGIELRNIFDVSFNAVQNPRYLLPVLYADQIFRLEPDAFYGDANFVLNYHPVFYARKKVWGFGFSFSPFINVGWINQAETFEDKWKSYSILGVNLSTKNESLIFPAMHVQLAYYTNEIIGEPRFEFKLIFKDLTMFQDFTSLKPEIALPSNN